jgi:hypothetical protein
MCPCIASITLKYNNATFSRSIYLYKLLYVFQTVPLPTIRSTKQYIQRQVLSNQYYCLLLSWMRWNYSSISSTIAAGSSIGLTVPDVVCTVLCSWWWAEEPSETRTAIHRNNSSISSTIAASRSIGLIIPDVVCTVLCSWWWAEETPETCRAIYRNK